MALILHDLLLTELLLFCSGINDQFICYFCGMTNWRLRIGVVVLMFGLVLFWNHSTGRAMTLQNYLGSDVDSRPAMQYYEAGDFSLGDFLPFNASGNILHGLFSRDWSPNLQLRIFGVSLVAPFYFFNPSLDCYFFIRQILLLPFEAFDIGYPFHSFW